VPALGWGKPRGRLMLHTPNLDIQVDAQQDLKVVQFFGLCMAALSGWIVGFLVATAIFCF
jgi:hypothetical protein